MFLRTALLTSKLVVCVSILMLSACSSSKLTSNRVQRTLDKWVKDSGVGGQIAVQGIQENPQDNTAKADAAISAVQYKQLGQAKIYSGPGVVESTHYNDGRWVITKILLTNAFDGWATTLEVE